MAESPSAPAVEVVAAVLVRDDGTFLLARRPPGKVYAGYWEFPGGKLEPGEAPEDALARELHEELGVEVVRAYPWITRCYAYAHARVRLRFFRVMQWRDVPRPREAQELAWQRVGAPCVEPMLPANAPVLAALALPSEYALTAAERYGVDTMLARLARALAADLRMIQIRDKDMAPPARADFARRVVELAHANGARVLVHSDVGLARAVGADGVHFSAAGLAALATRPQNLLAAASCHSAAELARASELGLDFALLGPVAETRSHPGAQTIGWDGFARIAHGACIPVYGIGGLRRGDLERAWEAGAHGIAMISGAWGD